MACSKYESTKETTNAARVVRLLLDPCTDMLRDVLRHYIPETAFPAKLQSEVWTIKPLLNSAQRSLLYPQHGSFTGNYQVFDISLLYILLRNISPIPQHAKGWGKSPDLLDRTISANIERIRYKRNEYTGHNNQSSMSDPTFLSIWQEVRQIATEIVKDVGLTIDYISLIDKLEHETMDPEQEEAYLKKLVNTEKTIEHLMDQQEQQSRLIQNQADAQNELEDIQNHQGTTIARHEQLITEQSRLLSEQRATIDKQGEVLTKQGQVQTDHGVTIAKHEQLITEQSQVQSEHYPELQLLDSPLDQIENEAGNVTAPTECPKPLSNTFEGVFKDIEDMKKSKDGKVRYCVLAYVFINSQINTKNIGLSGFHENFEEIANIIGLGTILYQDIKNTIENLQGQYLRALNEDGVYEFSNETVRDAVLVSYGQLEPVRVIQKCDARRIYRLIRTEKYEQKSGEIILKIFKPFYQDLVEKLFDNHFNVNDFLEQPCTDDDELTVNVFSGIQAEERIQQYYKIIHSMPHYSKPGLIKSMLTYHCSGCKRNEGSCLFGNKYIVFCAQHSSNEFVLPDFDICYLLDQSIYFEKAENVLTICRHLSTKNNCDEYFHRDVNTTKYTVLQHCVFKNWKDSVDSILSGYKPSTSEMFWTLSWCVYSGTSKITLDLCNYICTLQNANEYFDRYIWKVPAHLNLMSDIWHTQIGFTILHGCVIKGWDETVSVILRVHTPTKTDKNWTCAHLAAFFGRVSLLKMFVSMGQAVTDKTEEGYSVLQCLLLGMRYINKNIDKQSRTLYSLDVNETSSFTREVSLDYHRYKESFDYLVSVNLSLLEDFSLILDRHGNRVIHYLVINDCDEILDALLKLNINISHHRNQTDLPTALHLASYLGRHNMVEKLWMTGLSQESSDMLMEAIENGSRYRGKKFRFDNQWKEVVGSRINYNGANIKFSAVSFLEVKFGSEEDFNLTQRNLDRFINKSRKRLKAE